MRVLLLCLSLQRAYHLTSLLFSIASEIMCVSCVFFTFSIYRNAQALNTMQFQRCAKTHNSQFRGTKQTLRLFYQAKIKHSPNHKRVDLLVWRSGLRVLLCARGKMFGLNLTFSSHHLIWCTWKSFCCSFLSIAMAKTMCMCPNWTVLVGRRRPFFLSLSTPKSK